MAYAFDLDPAARTAILALEYDTDLAEAIEATRQICDDPRWEPGFHRIVDLRRVHTMLMQLDEVESILDNNDEMSTRLGAGLDVMIVSRPLTEVYARHYAECSPGRLRTVHVVPDRTAARALIDGYEAERPA